MAPVVPGILAVSAAFNALFSGFEPSVGPNLIAKVRSNLIDIASASWEVGTAAQALTELSWPALSVFNESAFPPSSSLPAAASPVDIVDIAKKIVSAKPASSLPLIPNEGSAADPASIGVAVLLANWTRTDKTNREYSIAASNQLKYLLEVAPRTSSGAISHRAKEVQLWSDFIYMVPPFIAYYGALQGGVEGRALLQVAYDQIRLYRDGLRDESGLWKHIALGPFQDNTHWATGNAWAAAGMMRVLSTMNHTAQGREFTSQQQNLTLWIDEILESSWDRQATNGGLRNVIDNANTFIDTASTALMASVTYRLAVFKEDLGFIPAANKALKFIKENISRDGWLLNAVDPLKFHVPLKPGHHSPEGQAFVLLLHSAQRAFSDFILANSSITKPPRISNEA